MCYCLQLFPAKIKRVPVERQRGAVQYVAPTGRRYSSRWSVETTVGEFYDLFVFYCIFVVHLHFGFISSVELCFAGGGGPPTPRNGGNGSPLTRSLFWLFASYATCGQCAFRPLPIIKASANPLSTTFLSVELFIFVFACFGSRTRADSSSATVASGHSAITSKFPYQLSCFLSHFLSLDKISPGRLEGQHSTPSTMPSSPQRSSGTTKHVHWEDAKRSASNFARNLRPSRRPVTPYPEDEEEDMPKPKERDTSSSTRKSRTEPETLEGIPIVFGEPAIVQLPGIDPRQVARYISVYRAFRVNQDGMAVPYQGAIPGFTPVNLNFQPQVPDTTNGPQLHYYVPSQNGSGAGVPMQAMQVPVGYQQIPVSVAVSVPVAAQGFQRLWRASCRFQSRLSARIARFHNHLFHILLLKVERQLIRMQAQPGVAIPLQQVATPQPVTQQPVAQPVMHTLVIPPGVQGSALAQQMYMQSPQPLMTGPVLMRPIPLQPGVHTEPALGVGLTSTESHSRNEQFAANRDIDEPQDFRPADDNPNRMYRVREVDGAWTVRNRYTIDNMGDFRWYITDEGVFYAVRLPN